MSLHFYFKSTIRPMKNIPGPPAWHNLVRYGTKKLVTRIHVQILVVTEEQQCKKFKIFNVEDDSLCALEFDFRSVGLLNYHDLHSLSERRAV